jgi:hypothetical protein
VFREFRGVEEYMLFMGRKAWLISLKVRAQRTLGGLCFFVDTVFGSTGV